MALRKHGKECHNGGQLGELKSPPVQLCLSLPWKGVQKQGQAADLPEEGVPKSWHHRKEVLLSHGS